MIPCCECVFQVPRPLFLVGVNVPRFLAAHVCREATCRRSYMASLRCLVAVMLHASKQTTRSTVCPRICLICSEHLSGPKDLRFHSSCGQRGHQLSAPPAQHRTASATCATRTPGSDLRSVHPA